MKKEYEESNNNPLDAPVPGQSLTDKPGNYPWEHPPLYETAEEASEYIWQTLHRKEFIEQVLGMLDAGVPVEALGRVILFAGFMEGKFTPDVAFIITEPVMKMILSIGMKGNVKNIKLSLQDITNNKQISEIAKLKDSNENFEKTVKSIQTDVKQIGLMSKPEPEDEEVQE
mgnify:CR=1 FL=1|jgi:hypothetical protein